MKFFLALTLILISLAGKAVSQNTYTLTVNIQGIKKHNGSLMIALHNQASSFTDNPKNSYSLQRIPVADGAATATYKFKNLPEGQYAISILQDDNGNKRMDYSMIGVPKEGFGVSNPPSSKYKKPHFDQSKFPVDANHNHITIKMMYF